MRRGAIILCGGKSTRMGTSKAMLPFGPELMLQRVVRLIGEVIPSTSTVVVAAHDQRLPRLPPEIVIARDRQPECGPLEGIATGLTALDDQAEAVFVSSCDVPLLVPAFVERMFDLLGDDEIAVPRVGEFHHPLAAVYQRTVLATIEKLLTTQRYRPVYLFEDHSTREVSVETLRDVDPELASLANCNRPEDYHRALRQAGFESET